MGFLSGCPSAQAQLLETVNLRDVISSATPVTMTLQPVSPPGSTPSISKAACPDSARAVNFDPRAERKTTDREPGSNA
jgi:hypothetical protein